MTDEIKLGKVYLIKYNEHISKAWACGYLSASDKGVILLEVKESIGWNRIDSQAVKVLPYQWGGTNFLYWSGGCGDIEILDLRPSKLRKGIREILSE